MSALPATLSGHGLTLRRVTPADAAYVHRLRSDPALSRHLHPVTGGVPGQRRWIEETQSDPAQAYYVISAATDCGLVRLSGITPHSFAWGSWILDPATRPRRAALACALLVYRAGFGAGCAVAAFDVRRANGRTLAFHDRFGATRTGATARDILYRLTRADWQRLAPRHAAALQGAPA